MYAIGRHGRPRIRPWRLLNRRSTHEGAVAEKYIVVNNNNNNNNNTEAEMWARRPQFSLRCTQFFYIRNINLVELKTSQTNIIQHSSSNHSPSCSWSSFLLVRLCCRFDVYPHIVFWLCLGRRQTSTSTAFKRRISRHFLSQSACLAPKINKTAVDNNVLWDSESRCTHIYQPSQSKLLQIPFSIIRKTTSQL